MDDGKLMLKGLQEATRQLMCVQDTLTAQEDVSKEELLLLHDTIAPLMVYSLTICVGMVDYLKELPPYKRDGMQARFDKLVGQHAQVTQELRGLVEGHMVMLTSSHVLGGEATKDEM